MMRPMIFAFLMALMLAAASVEAQTNVQPLLSVNRVLFTVGVDRYFESVSGSPALAQDWRLSANLSYGFKFISFGGGYAYYTEHGQSQPFLAARLAIFRNGKIGG